MKTLNEEFELLVGQLLVNLVDFIDTSSGIWIPQQQKLSELKALVERLAKVIIEKQKCILEN